MPQRNLLTAVCLAIVCLACYSKAPTNRFARDFEQAIRIVDRYYVQPQDKQELFEASLQGMMKSLDEHSSFLPGEQLQEMNEKLNQGYGGVGIRIDFTKRLTAYRSSVRSSTPLLSRQVSWPAMSSSRLTGSAPRPLLWTSVYPT